jgi:hypothetical protein
MDMENFNTKIFAKNLAALKMQNPTLAEQLENTSISDNIEVVYGASALPIIKYRNLLTDQLDQPLKAATAWANRAFNPNLKDMTYIVAGFCAGYHIQALRASGANITAVIEPNLEILKAALSLQDFSEILPQITIWTNQKDFKLWLSKTLTHRRQMDFLVFPQALNGTSRECLLACKRSFAFAKGSQHILPYVIALTFNQTAFGDYQKLQSTFGTLSQSVKGAISMQLMTPVIAAENKSNLEIQDEFISNMSTHIPNLIKSGQAQIVLSMFEPVLKPETVKKLRDTKSIFVLWLTESDYPAADFKELELYDYIFVCRQELLTKLEEQGIYNAIYLPLFSESDNSLNMEEMLGYIYNDHFNTLFQLLEIKYWKELHQTITPEHELYPLYQKLEKIPKSPNLENLTLTVIQNPDLVTNPDIKSKLVFLNYFQQIAGQNVK